MTLKKLYSQIKSFLLEGSIDAPEEEALSIIEAVFSISKSDLILTGEKDISPDDADRALNFAKRRVSGEPLQYIIGYWEFYGRKFYVGEGVLIPRDDTEVVLRSTLPFLTNLRNNKKDIKILDLCSGSGILAITLKHLYPEAKVTAVEISDEALPYLKKNISSHLVDINLIHGDIFEEVKKFPDREFDLIISNPPYVRTEEMRNLQSEVRFEPALALAGGEDGCDFYRKIVPMYTTKLKAGGMLALEFDSTQAQVISQLMDTHGYHNIQVFDDLGGVHRAINGTVFEF